MQKRFIDFIVGLFMLAGIAGLLTLAYRVSSFSSFESRTTYSLSASFDNIGGLKLRAPVTLSGVKIGQVSSIALDPATFKANVTFLINAQDNDLPVDTSASIYTQGLLGANYISLSPGFSEQSLKNGDAIMTTRSALILEQLIGQLMFKLTNSDSSSGSSSDSTTTSTETTDTPEASLPGTTSVSAAEEKPAVTSPVTTSVTTDKSA